MRRAPTMLIVVSRPDIIAPVTPQVSVSCPVSQSPGIEVFGRSQSCAKRSGVCASPYSSPWW